MPVANTSAPSYIRAGVTDEHAVQLAEFAKREAQREQQQQERHYITQPLVELYGDCMVVLKVS